MLQDVTAGRRIEEFSGDHISLSEAVLRKEEKNIGVAAGTTTSSLWLTPV